MYVFYRFVCCCVIKLELKTNWKLYGPMHSCTQWCDSYIFAFSYWKKGESQAGIKIARQYQQLQICRWYHFNGRKWKELKSLLIRVKEKSEKAAMKLIIQKIKIMVSRPIASWQIEGEKVEAMTDLIFLGFRITADGDHSHEIKTHLLLGRKVMTKLECILKSRDATLSTKVCPIKAMVF